MNSNPKTQRPGCNHHHVRQVQKHLTRFEATDYERMVAGLSPDERAEKMVRAPGGHGRESLQRLTEECQCTRYDVLSCGATAAELARNRDCVYRLSVDLAACVVARTLWLRSC